MPRKTPSRPVRHRVGEDRVINPDLVASEQRYRHLFEAAPHAAFLLVADGPNAGRILDANERAATMHGWTPGELLGRHIGELDVASDARLVQTRITELLAKGSICFRVRHRRRDGSEFPVEVSARLSTLHGQRCIVSFNRDISEQEHAEHQVLEQQRRLELAARASNIGFWDWDLVTDSVFFSPEWKAQLGYAVDEIGHHYREWEQRVHPDDLPPTLVRLGDYRNGRIAAWDVEFRMRHRDGSWRWIAARGQVHRDADGTPVRMVGCHLDITERKLADEQLRAAEARAQQNAERMRAIYESEPECIQTTTLDGRLLDMNPAGLRMIECERLEDVVGRALVDLVHPDDAAALTTMLQRAIDDGSATVEVRIRGLRGAERWTETHCVPLRAPDGTMTSLLAVTRDTTARRAAEAERATLTRQLLQLQRTEAIGMLASGIAHDFNNVLAAICGNLELAALNVVESTPVHENLVEIRKAAGRASALVRQILAFSRSQEPTRTPVALAPVFSDLVRFLRATIAKTIAIEVEIADDLPPVLADSAQVHQVLINLCTNASHAMSDAPGILSLTARPTILDAAAATDLGTNPGNYVCLSVQDTGIGMDAATLARVFEPFFTTKPAGRGTGLGLSVVASIVRAHGGGIAAHSEPGRGSTFRVWLPVVVDAAPPEPLVELPLGGHNEHILLLDDESALLRATSRNLERLGYRVTTFARPDNAIAALADGRAHFDLILTDHEMPGMPGHTVVQCMRAVRPNVPIIVCSGYLHPDAIAALQAYGVAGVVTKPCSTAELTTTIRKVLTQHRRPRVRKARRNMPQKARR